MRIFVRLIACVGIALTAAGLCGLAAAAAPTIRAVRLSIVNGLRTVG